MQLELLAIPALLSLGHFLGLRLQARKQRYAEYVQSFTAGFSVAYVFLFLLPEVQKLQVGERDLVMVFVLLGFVFFHVLLKLALRREGEERFLWDELLHLLVIGVFNFLISFILVQIVLQSLQQGLVIFALVFLHVLLSDLAHRDTHQTLVDRWRLPVISGLTFAGAFLAIWQVLDPSLIATLFAFGAGAIVYISLREELPQSERSKPLIFFVGAVFFVCLFMLFL